jgi:hypothetical protein
MTDPHSTNLSSQLIKEKSFDLFQVCYPPLIKLFTRSLLEFQRNEHFYINSNIEINSNYLFSIQF